MKYIIVYGGVISSLGKGTIASSIGFLLKSTGLKVTAIKIDPYLNIDAGTMSPFEHGEVYVLDDGGEVDLDLGNYERFLNVNLSSDHNLTTGKLYMNVIQKERKGDYLGKTVQALPHLTDYIQEYIETTAKIPVGNPPEVADICIVELGGTTGDQEQTIYLEALSRFSKRHGDNCCNVYVSLVPSVHGSEPKTKPTQLALREFSSYHLSPDILCLRTNKDTEITIDEKNKLKHFLKNGLNSRIIACPDADNLYDVPWYFRNKTDIISTLIKQFYSTGARDGTYGQSAMRYDDPKPLELIREHFDKPLMSCKIAIVGKYTGQRDTYLSLFRGLEHASFAVGCKLEVDWIDSETVSETELYTRMYKCHGIVIPGGFGARGLWGMIEAAQYARNQNVPILGICLGMQVMLIESAQNSIGQRKANSTEFDPNTNFPIIHLHANQKDTNGDMGGTMYLGAHQVHLTQKTMVSELYHGAKIVSERYRHRYQVNPTLFPSITDYKAVGITLDEGYISIIQNPDREFSVGCQFHPEYLTRHQTPHPLFVGVVRAAYHRAQKKLVN